MLQLFNLTSRSCLQTGCWPSHRPPSDFPHTQSCCKINTSIPPLLRMCHLRIHYSSISIQCSKYCRIMYFVFFIVKHLKQDLKHLHASQTFSVFTQDKYRFNFAAAKERGHICSFLAAVMKHKIVQWKLVP